jgi:hypothetical protein
VPRPDSLSQACSGPMPGLSRPRSNGLSRSALRHPSANRSGCHGERRASCPPRKLLLFAKPQASRLDAKKFQRRNYQERMKKPEGVRATGDAGIKRIGQPAFTSLQLRACFLADHALENARHRRIRMRSGEMAPHNQRDLGTMSYFTVKDYKTCGYLQIGSILSLAESVCSANCRSRLG